MSIGRMVIGGAAAAAVVLALAAAGWWFFIREDNELATSAPDIPLDLAGQQATQTPAGDATQEPGAEPTEPPAAPGGGLTFRIIPERSEAAYFADEKLARLPLPSTAKGVTKDIAGEVHLTEDGFALDTSKESRFTVDLRTLQSDEGRRDSRVQSDGLQTDIYPTATFVVTSVSGVDPSVAAGEEHAFQMTGVLDLHGVQREITWEVKARREGNVITALATTNFLYADFGIPVLNFAGIVSVEDDVTLQVQIVAEAT